MSTEIEDRSVTYPDVKIDDIYFHDGKIGRWKVVKKNQVSIDVKPCDLAGNIIPGRGIRTRDFFLRKILPSDGEASVPTSVGIPYVALPEIGKPVKWSALGLRRVPKAQPADVWIVAGESRDGKGVKLNRLGGDPEGRYYPNIGPAFIEVMTLAQLAEHLIEHS